jgi:DNA-binding transcriptional regulator YhcF (GntR family)
MLPPAAYSFWKFGTHAKNSRSEMVRSLTLSAIAKGWYWAEYQAVMTDPAALGTARIRENNHPGKHLAGEWKRGHAYAAANPPSRPAPDQKILDALNRAKYAVKSIKWTRRTGSRNAKVLLAHFEKALEWGEFHYPASSRKLAQIAGVSLLTGYTACRELEKLGFLSKLDKKGIDYPAARGSSRIIRDRQTTWWQINIDVIYNSSSHIPFKDKDVRRSVINIDQSHDAFHHWGLGATGYRVLSGLDFVQGVSIKELAERLALRPQLVKQKLRQLEEHGIAKIIGKINWHLGDFEPGSIHKLLNRVAAAAGTWGRGEWREKWYRTERLKQRENIIRISEQAFARRKQWQEAGFKRAKNQ